MPTSQKTIALWLLCFLGSSAAYNYTENVLSHPPNETRSITFKPFPNDPDLGHSDWTWTVNITDVPLPNEKITYPQSGEGSPDSRGLVVTYDLVWPEDKTESPDCAPVLGQACVDALLETGKVDGNTNGGGCRLTRSWNDLPECKDTLYSPAGSGDARREGWHGAITRGIDSLESGESLNDGLMNYIYDSKDSSALYSSVVNMLQILLLHSQPPSPALRNVSAREPYLACMRVKTDKLPVEDDGEDGNEQSDQQRGDSAAPGEIQINWLVTGVALIMAMAMAQGL